MGNREGRVLRVIERRVQPVGCAMAVLASRRKKLRLCRVSRVSRILVVGLVARDAKVAVQVVVIVDVAIGACPRWNGMRPGQREASLRVIELAIGPLNGVMAKLARGREAGVRRIVRVLKIFLVA